jgi:hypothetical protein
LRNPALLALAGVIASIDGETKQKIIPIFADWREFNTTR